MIKLAVMGNPIAHSMSPLIHQAFAEQCGLEVDYQKILVPLHSFDSELSDFFNKNSGFGCNVTVPFKEKAYMAVTHCTNEASFAKAVNTIKHDNRGMLIGHNTDGVGLVNDLRKKHVHLPESDVLIIGAGGATRGVMWPLLNAGVASITIVNRTFEKAHALTTELSNERCRAMPVEKLSSLTPNLIINATSSSLQREMPAPTIGNLERCECVYDMVYSAEPTPFMTFAHQAGIANVFDGLGMLVEQAAVAFSWWTGCEVATDEVLATLRSSLSHT
jgi:shikimate dehydrogenase